MPITPVGGAVGSGGQGATGVKQIPGLPNYTDYSASAQRRSSKNGVTSSEVMDPNKSIFNFLSMLGNDPTGNARAVEPLDMPSMSVSPQEFQSGSAATGKYLDNKYGTAQTQQGKEAGQVNPQSDPIGSGWTSNYNPGQPGIDYTNSGQQASGGAMAASSYNPQGDEGLQGALGAAAMGADSPQAPPDIFRALKRRRIIDQVGDPAVAQLASQYGIIPGDEMLRNIRGY